MGTLPVIAADGRGRSIAKVAALAVGQAAAAGIAAFATREVFVALGAGTSAVPAAALLALALSGLAIAGLRVRERVTAERVGHAYAAAVRLALFRHIAKLPARQVAERRAGSLALRFVGDLQAIRGWVAMGLARLISAAIVIPLTVCVLFLLDPVMGAAAAGPLLLGLCVMAVVGRGLGPAHRRVRERRARLAADMSERLPHGPELRLLGRIGIECRRLARRTERVIEAAMDRARGVAMLHAVPDVIAGASAAALLLAASLTGAAPAEAAGALAALGLLIQPVRALAGVWDRWRAWVVARDKCADVLSRRPLRRRQSAAAPGAAADHAHGLVFRGVSVAGAGPFDVGAAAGEKIAIVGRNGAGKSSLLALAAGLEAPEEGRVLLDGRDVHAVGDGERARAIRFAGPRSPILKGSLRRALTMGSVETPPDAAIEAAARVAGLGALLDRIGGLDGTVLEGGRNLSAGEARRVLVCRALTGAPRLVLLDEPDDALDPEGNRLLARLIRTHPATMLMVTHDLDLARTMDTLWLVEDGRVVAHGRPADLLGGDGPAAALFEPRLAG